MPEQESVNAMMDDFFAGNNWVPQFIPQIIPQIILGPTEPGRHLIYRRPENRKGLPIMKVFDHLRAKDLFWLMQLEHGLPSVHVLCLVCRGFHERRMLSRGWRDYVQALGITFPVEYPLTITEGNNVTKNHKSKKG